MHNMMCLTFARELHHIARDDLRGCVYHIAYHIVYQIIWPIEQLPVNIFLEALSFQEDCMPTDLLYNVQKPRPIIRINSKLRNEPACIP
jgi:hypothetical protein